MAMNEEPIDPETLKVLMASMRDREPPETAEETTAREAAEEKRRTEEEAWRIKNEEAIRFAVPRTIEALRKEATEKLAEAEQLEAMFREFPDLRKYTGRWNKVAYYSKTVNHRVNNLDIRHNCGCCSDSPLEVWPYIETAHGRIYSDPASFFVGRRDSYSGGDVASHGWQDGLRKAGIPEEMIERIGRMMHDFGEEPPDEEDP